MNKLDIIYNAFKNGYAIPQFNVNNLEWIKYILEECQKENSPVILGVSPSASKYMGGYQVVRNIVDALIEEKNLTIPVILHLDHGRTLEDVQMATNANFDSIMADLSKLSLEENIEATLLAKEILKDKIFEAEIGYVGVAKDEIRHISVNDAIYFNDHVKPHMLAPAVGNVHGLYKGEPDINFSLIKELKDQLNIPLVLHGGTGLSDDVLKQCVLNGVAKINFNTELQVAWAEAVKKFINENSEIYDPRKIIGAGEEALKQVVSHKIQILNCKDKG